MLSSASMLPAPELVGNAVVDSPSPAALAPMPPLANRICENAIALPVDAAEERAQGGGAPALGEDRVRDSLSEAAVDRPGQEVPGELPRAAGGGKAGVQDAAGGGVHGEGPVRSLVARRERIDGALDRIDGVGVRVVHHRVEAAGDLLGRARVVHVDGRARDREAARDARLVLVEPVRLHGVAVLAIRQRRDGAAHRGLGADLEGARQGGQIDQLRHRRGARSAGARTPAARRPAPGDRPGPARAPGRCRR